MQSLIYTHLHKLWTDTVRCVYSAFSWGKISCNSISPLLWSSPAQLVAIQFLFSDVRFASPCDTKETHANSYNFCTSNTKKCIIHNYLQIYCCKNAVLQICITGILIFSYRSSNPLFGGPNAWSNMSALKIYENRTY